MTTEERKMLKDIHDALFKPPPQGGPPFIEQIGHAVAAYQQASWFTRFVIRFVMGASAFTGGAIILREIIVNLGKGGN